MACRFLPSNMPLVTFNDSMLLAACRRAKLIHGQRILPTGNLAHLHPFGLVHPRVNLRSRVNRPSASDHFVGADNMIHQALKRHLLLHQRVTKAVASDPWSTLLTTCSNMPEVQHAEQVTETIGPRRGPGTTNPNKHNQGLPRPTTVRGCSRFSGISFHLPHSFSHLRKPLRVFLDCVDPSPSLRINTLLLSLISVFKIIFPTREKHCALSSRNAVDCITFPPRVQVGLFCNRSN